jgi:ankyrin repeat protein
MSSANGKLCHAAASGDVAEIERQIAAGADPNAFEGTTSATPLRWAANGGHVAAIALLVKAGARADGADSAGYTPLMVAAYYVHTAAIDALLAAGADVHRVNYDGDTVLHLVLTFGHLSAARVLVEAGARTDMCNKEGNRPVDVVRCLHSLVAAARSRHATAHAQVCWGADKSNEAALRALLGAAAPWSRRRPVAVGCYAVGWE